MKPPRPPKPWAREAAGRYRSADGRFGLEGEPGRWFVVDEAERDELGLARTLGPFDSLKDAQAEAERLRSTPPERSNLATRLAKASTARRSGPERGGAPATPEATRGATLRRVEPSAPPQPPAPAEPAEPLELPGPPAPEAPEPPEPAWLRRLPADRAEAIRQIRSHLERLGLGDAWDLARAEVASNEPAVAHGLLARRIRRTAVEPWRTGEALDAPGLPAAVAAALDRLRRAGATSDDLLALAGFVAERAVAAALEELSGRERDPGTAAGTAGWRLVEHAPETQSDARRIHLDSDDLAPLEPPATDAAREAARPGVTGGRRPGRAGGRRGQEDETPGTLRS